MKTEVIKFIERAICVGEKIDVTIGPFKAEVLIYDIEIKAFKCSPIEFVMVHLSISANRDQERDQELAAYLQKYNYAEIPFRFNYEFGGSKRFEVISVQAQHIQAAVCFTQNTHPDRLAVEEQEEKIWMRKQSGIPGPFRTSIRTESRY